MFFEEVCVLYAFSHPHELLVLELQKAQDPIYEFDWKFYKDVLYDVEETPLVNLPPSLQ